jgi:DNA-binding winged helix-turn-helix (wHTH) protein
MTNSTEDVVSFGPFSLDASRRLLLKDGVPVSLGARALDILIALVSRSNQPVGKRELMAAVWPDVIVEEGSLRFQMAVLRKALGDGRDGNRYISTLAGRGYCFVVPISRTNDRTHAPTTPAPRFSHANLPIMDIAGEEHDRDCFCRGGGGRRRLFGACCRRVDFHAGRVCARAA